MLITATTIKHFFLRAIPAFITCLLLTSPLLAQRSEIEMALAERIEQNRHFDTSYYHSYDRRLTTRLYLSQKYTRLELTAPKGITNAKYRPNTTLNLGVGATYRSLTLNLAYGFPFLNPDVGKGKTSYLDLQSHIYTRKWIIDGFGQFYRGYFLSPKGLSAASPNDYYLRSDLRVNLFGGAAYHAFNWRKFSYRAPMLQNEWQKKSAGSFLLGGEFDYSRSWADAPLVPDSLRGQYANANVTQVKMFQAGPGAGYAYTLVLFQHFFVTAGLSANLNLGFTREFSGNTSTDRWGLAPNLLYRGVIGYNSKLWTANLSLVNSTVLARGEYPGYDYMLRVGNVRLTVAHRFKPGHKFRLFTRKIEKKFQ
jgi:hypothetical protein